VRLGLFGGAFDPPHNGHVALVRAAKQALGLDRVIVVVAAAPGHKDVEAPADVRLELARLAFPDDEVVLDEHARTVDMLRAHPDWQGAVFLIGADELAGFRGWKEPDEVIRLVTLGVAARPGHPAPMAESERVTPFELDESVTSRELRARLQAGDDVSDAVPAAVWNAIERERLYGHTRPRYTQSA
jgi:nicotinate-nucleotide adenylyltransferase